MGPQLGACFVSVSKSRFGPQVAAHRLQKSSQKNPNPQITTFVGPHFGGILDHFTAQVRPRDILYVLFGDFFRTLQKIRKRSVPRGAGYAIRPRRRMFREGRQFSIWHHFGLHFEVILELRAATMLLLGPLWCTFGHFLAPCFADRFPGSFSERWGRGREAPGDFRGRWQWCPGGRGISFGQSW